MEIGNHRICHCKVVRREDELVRPAFVRFQMSVCAYGALDSTHHGSTHGTNLSVHILGTVHNADGFFVHNHLFRVRLMLREVFHINVAKITQTSMKSNISKIDTLDFQALHQFTAEVQTGSRSRYRTFIASKDRLETF